MTILGPVLVLIFFWWLSRVTGIVEVIATRLGVHGKQIEEVTNNLKAMVAISRESRDAALANMKAHQVLSERMVRELAVIAEVRNAVPEPIPPHSDRLEQMRTLVNVINVALNDLSMTVTQVLVRLLEAVQGDKGKIRDFVAGLVEAYSVGDKNAFFRSFTLKFSESPEVLVSIARDSAEVRHNVSKILREVEEVKSLVEGCDQNNLIRIVFEDGELWRLYNVLIDYFEHDGTPRI